MDNLEIQKNLSRPRSARRLRHEAQAQVFEKEAGNLERIRDSLGLRPSQLCEILKVHPSAWTRWTRTGRAPPHVFQMLEWYIELLRWRGQHNPLPAAALRPRALEDLETYVPANETFMVKAKADKGTLPSYKWMVLLWGTQIAVLATLAVFLWKYSAAH